MIEINKCKLTTTGLSTNQGKLIPGATTYWGFITGNVTDQTDLISWIESQGYLTEHQHLKTVNNQSLVGYGNITIEASVPSYYATKSWVESQGYLTSVPSEYATEQFVTDSLSGYATESWVESQGYLVSNDLSQYATRQWVTGRGYITSSALEGYATESWVTSQGYLTTVPEGYATESWVTSNFLGSTALTGYATQSWVTSQSYLTSTSTMMVDILSRLSSIESTLDSALAITTEILS